MTLSLSPTHTQGRNRSALQLSEATGIATTLAVTGSLFAWLLTRAPQAEYAACFAVSSVLALLVAGRVRQQE